MSRKKLEGALQGGTDFFLDILTNAVKRVQVKGSVK